MSGVGIDFGTTNSVLALYDGKKFVPMLDHTKAPHPSVVWYHGGQINVGREAKNKFHTYADEPGNVFVRSIKRQLGKDKVFNIFGRNTEAWEVAGQVFAHLVDDAQRELRSQKECVITVPVYFDGRQRADIRKAAQAAGLYVKSFVHEPFAAFVGYVESHGGFAQTHGNYRTVLVFDWGGGTLDITLIRIEKGRLYEVSMGGLADVAGDNFDEALRNFTLDEFYREHGLSAGNVHLRPESVDRLAVQAETAKITLSSEDKAGIELLNFHRQDGRTLDLASRVRRVQFEKLIVPSVNQAIHQVDEVMGRVGAAASEVDLVLLIGGTSLIPAVDREVRKIFGARVTTVPNAPTIIAEGAAAIAHHDWTPSLVHPVSVRISDNSLYTVFPEDSVLLQKTKPKELTFFCTDNRDGDARLVLTEGSNTVSPGPRVKGILPVPVRPDIQVADVERVHARFEFDENQILNVTGYGTIEQKVSSMQIYDLNIGLRTS